MTRNPQWKCGFEVELMAPKGKSRETLASTLAGSLGGLTRRRFYPQSEVDTASEGKGYESLTLAFDVLDAQGHTQFTLADDVTLNADIDSCLVGADGWYRILSTQRTHCDLVEAQCDATASLDDVLRPLARLFHTEVRLGAEGLRIVDSKTATVAVALPLAGDRERACEIITRPFQSGENVRAALQSAFALAKVEQFFVPKESATHIHFDGTRLQDPTVLRNLVAVFHRFRLVLRRRFATNEACVRLGPWHRNLFELVFSDAFLNMKWSEAARHLHGTAASKFCDFNIINLFEPFAAKKTFEVRILPTTLEANALVDAALVFEALLERIVASPVLRPLPTLEPSAEASALFEAYLNTGTWRLSGQEMATVRPRTAPTAFSAPRPASSGSPSTLRTQ